MERTEDLASPATHTWPLARHDGLSRNTPDASDLVELPEENKALIMVDGRVYDLWNAGDRLILDLHGNLAEYEHRRRSMWVAATRSIRAGSRRT
jgi:hypothetical protein